MSRTVVLRGHVALHLATALLERADAFLTSDKKLARFGGLPVELLQVNL